MSVGVDRGGEREEFSRFADVIRREYERRGYGVHVSTNYESITVTERGYVGGNEQDFHVKVRSIPESSRA